LKNSFNLIQLPNNYFSFKQFTIYQDHCSLRVATDSCILGAWYAQKKLSADYILDIGSGTGLLTLMLAQKTSSIIHGIEIEPSCFSQLVENINQSPWPEKCFAKQGDVRSFPFTNQYDFIISNPPFFEGQLVAGDIKKDLAKHSTSLSLSELFNVVKKILNPQGSFGILLPYSRTEEATTSAAEFGLFCTEKLFIKQTTGHTFFRTIMTFEKKNSGTSVQHEFPIRDEKNEYSPEFTTLLKEYYLHL